MLAFRVREGGASYKFRLLGCQKNYPITKVREQKEIKIFIPKHWGKHQLEEVEKSLPNTKVIWIQRGEN